MASLKSVVCLKDVNGIEILLSPWDDPRDGEQARRSLLDSIDLSRVVLRELDLLEIMANPLAARSFEASLNVNDQGNFYNI